MPSPTSSPRLDPTGLLWALLAAAFGSTIAVVGKWLLNAGAGPLELFAGEVVRKRQNVYQRIFSSDGSYRDKLAGSFDWHQGHDHFHFNDYALYTLQPTWTKSNRTGAKTSFCVMDTDLVNGSLDGAPHAPVIGLHAPAGDLGDAVGMAET